MKIYEIQISRRFYDKLSQTLYFIEKDSKSAAKKFKLDTLKKIKELEKMPFRCRQSIYFDNENIRDLIFKGYTIVFEVNDGRVIVFSIVKHQLKP